jgi:hypothetical protein
MNWKGPHTGVRHGEKVSLTIAGRKGDTEERCEAVVRVKADPWEDPEKLLVYALEALHKLIGDDIDDRKHVKYPEEK